MMGGDAWATSKVGEGSPNEFPVLFSFSDLELIPRPLSLLQVARSPSPSSLRTIPRRARQMRLRPSQSRRLSSSATTRSRAKT
jgi:hypothetical protein